MKSLEIIKAELEVKPLCVSVVTSGFAILKRKDLYKDVDIFKVKIDAKYDRTFYDLEKAVSYIDNKRII